MQKRRKNIRIISAVIVTLSLSLSVHLELLAQTVNVSTVDKPLVFYLNGTRALRLDKSRGNRPSIPIPGQLVITPGTYAFAGGSYDLQREGLYRFVFPDKTNLQRIVYETDIDSFLSAISWTHSHGNSDDQKSMQELTEKALHSKLLITCSTVSLWAESLLTSRGIKARRVGAVTLDEWNSYDDGHDLVEIWRNKWHKWVLYDLDNSNYFVNRQNKVPMSLVEFIKAVADKDYKIIHISSPIPVDASNFKAPDGYDYAFYMEAILSNIRKWYERVMQVPLIYDDTEKRYFFYDAAFMKRVGLHDPNDKFIPREEFMKKFYSGVDTLP
jgi:hypothetical protein